MASVRTLNAKAEVLSKGAALFMSINAGGFRRSTSCHSWQPSQRQRSLLQPAPWLLSPPGVLPCRTAAAATSCLC